MLKILWKIGEIAPEEQFLPLSTIFYYLMLDFYVKTGIRFLRGKRLFEITGVEITRVDGRWVLHVTVAMVLSARRQPPVDRRHKGIWFLSKKRFLLLETVTCKSKNTGKA